MAELFNPLYPDPPVKLKVAPRDCKECGRPFVPVSNKGYGATHCPDCRRKVTEKARATRAANRAAQIAPAQPEPVTAAEPQPVLVTTLEWWDPEYKLPDTSRYVIEISDNGVIQVLPYSTQHHAFNTYDFNDNTNHAIPVALWADIPENLQAIQDKIIKAHREKEDNN